jgi:hypothetical protein
MRHELMRYELSIRVRVEHTLLSVLHEVGFGAVFYKLVTR